MEVWAQKELVQAHWDWSMIQLDYYMIPWTTVLLMFGLWVVPCLLFLYGVSPMECEFGTTTTTTTTTQKKKLVPRAIIIIIIIMDESSKL